MSRTCLSRLLTTSLVLLALSARALDQNLPPGSNFDLSHWKLTLPDTSASEQFPTQLTAGFINEYFFTGADGAMVFWCPVTGGHTSGSSYPRSELRELISPADDNVNWTGYGAHTLTAQCKVTQQPSSQKVIIGQIHGFNVDPLVKLQCNNGKIEALVKDQPTNGSDIKYTFATVGLNTNVNYQIKVLDGLLTITINGQTTNHNFFATSQAWTNVTYYFKAGAYVQDNSGAINEGGMVMFYELNVTHGVPTNRPPVITNFSTTSGEQFSFALLCSPGSNYVIEVSTNLASWIPVITNSASNGVIQFTDTNPPALGGRFYRGKTS